ncbi:MAG: response regulator [Planctomycetes bacterium]|nr:response regulator [Planctomycetota bacterium]
MAAILVVEDDRNQRLLLEEELAGDGHAVLTVASGPDALATIEKAMPDLVVMDIAMPEMDGLELLARLLALNHHLPVIIHTAYASYKDNFMSWAADAYVLKRGDLRELKDAVRHVLTKGHGPGPAELTAEACA